LSLREALDRLAAGAKILLSYTNESLPLESRVCVQVDSATLGDALSWLLRDTRVAPVAAGGSQVALVPSDASAAGDRAATPRTLDRVVVTGNTLES
jgi:iron complex outermembrane receptor protein